MERQNLKIPDASVIEILNGRSSTLQACKIRKLSTLRRGTKVFNIPHKKS